MVFASTAAVHGTPDTTPIPEDVALRASGERAPVVCNLGTSIGFSVREVLQAAEAVTGGSIRHAEGPRRAGDPPVLVASTERAREVLGWAPRLSTLDLMIGSAWGWRRVHPEGYGDCRLLPDGICASTQRCVWWCILTLAARIIPRLAA